MTSWRIVIAIPKFKKNEKINERIDFVLNIPMVGIYVCLIDFEKRLKMSCECLCDLCKTVKRQLLTFLNNWIGLVLYYAKILLLT